jgi:DNA polymerase-3 subunit delta'
MWRGISGHDEVVERFRRTLASGRLASTYLFVGPSGIGKRRFAVELAHSLLCTEKPDAALEPCERCESCRLFATDNHPDLDIIGLRPDKSELAISQFVGFDDELKQEGLCHRIALKPFFGGRRVAIVDDADHFNQYSANCLLKTLEEPPPQSLLILIGTSPSRQLPTIRSRSQVVRFAPLAPHEVAEILLKTGAMSDRTQALRAAELSQGSVQRATQMVDPTLGEFRELLLRDLRSPVLESVRMARSVQGFIDEAGKEPRLRRDRLRIVIDFAIDEFRTQLRESGEAPTQAIIAALGVCLSSLEHIDRNANLGIVIQHWCEELAAAKCRHSSAWLLSAL